MTSKLIQSSFAAAALLAAASLSAQAADLQVHTKAPAYVAAFSWTGFYIGGNLGGAWGQSTYTFLPGPAWTAGSGTQLATDGAATLNMASVSGGGQAGYNWQADKIVFGLEADIGYIGLRKTNVFTQPGPACGCIVTPYAFTESSRSDWMATVRGRLGVAFDRSLVYVTGGVAFADSASADTLTFPTLAPAATFTGAGARSNVQTGWTLGGGFEWAFSGQWSAKAEYLYARFPTTTTAMNPINTIFTQSYTDRLSVSVARVGLNYKLN